MRTRMVRTPGVLGLLAAGLIGAPAFVWAQAVLEEVVVTAQKREQGLQDVPVSVSAMAGEALRARQLVDAETLSAVLPNIHISESAIGDKLFIRGIGSGINAGFEQSVGTFIDGVYQGRSLQSRSRFLDVERVEVLRGPQGIFFGNNAIAGALNITSRRPAAEATGWLNSYREFRHGEYHVEGGASVPLSDVLAVRVAGLADGMDGWLRNPHSGQHEGDERNRAGRITAVIEPAAGIDATLKLETGRSAVLGRHLQVAGCPPATGAAGLCALVTAPVLASLGGEYAEPLFAEFDTKLDQYTSYDTAAPARFTAAIDGRGATEARLAVPPPDAHLAARDRHTLENRNATLTLNWHRDRHVLTAVSGFSRYRADMLQSADFLPVPAAAVQQQEGYSQFSQELRLMAARDAPAEYLLGLYYQASDLDIAERISLYFPPPYFQPAATWFAGGCGVSGPDDTANCRQPATLADADSAHAQHETTLAAFAAFTVPLGATLSATLGARHTVTRKQLLRSQALIDRAPGITVSCIAAIVAATGCQEAAPLLLTARNPPAGQAFGWRAGALHASRQDSAFTPSLTVQWDIGGGMLYGSHSKGFKAGGFDQRNLFLDATTGTFGPERVDATEFGLKTRLLEGSLHLNLALFRSDYAGLQVSTFDGVVNFLVNNAASARSQGLEADLRWQPGAAFVVSAAFALLDATWQDYPNAQCTARMLASAPVPGCSIDADSGLLVQNLRGKDMLMAPAWSGNVGVEYRRPLARGLELQAHLLLHAEAARYLAADNDPATVQPRFLKMNARLALAGASGWELALVGRNLTDVLTSSHAEDLPLQSVNSYFHLTDRPRTLALQAQYHW